MTYDPQTSANGDVPDRLIYVARLEETTVGDVYKRGLVDEVVSAVRWVWQQVLRPFNGTASGAFNERSTNAIGAATKLAASTQSTGS